VKKKTTGIYAIIITPHLYIGRAVNIELRLYKHLRSLRKGTHHNRYMQRVFNKYGEESMRTAILCECKKSQLNELEIAHIAAKREDPNLKVMNLTDGGDGTIGYEFTDEHREKLSKALIGNTHTLGYVPTAETRKKLSKANKGRKLTAAQKKSIDWTGRKHTDESKEKMAVSHIGNTNCLGYKHTDEAKRKMSESAKKAWKVKHANYTEEERRIRSEASRKGWERRRANAITT